MSNSFKYAFPSNRIQTRVRLQQKLNPRHFPQMSPVMGALVGYLVDAEYFEPSISEMTVTTDGFVLARVGHEPTFGHYIGPYDDVVRNWVALLSMAGLTPEERAYADAMFAERIGYYGPSQA